MADLTIEWRESIGLATVMSRRDVTAEAIGAALDVPEVRLEVRPEVPPEVPQGPLWRSGGGGLALIGTGPGTWLAMAEGASPFWADDLRERLSGLASVSDQSSGYAVMRLSGADARTVLQRGIAIDLDPAVFVPGAAAVTMLGHIGVILWRPGPGAVYEMAVFRSYSESLARWLEAAVAAL